MIKKISIVAVIMQILIGFTAAQEATFDWKMHNVGNVRQVVTNRGGLNAKGDATFDYKGLLNCEHPLNSNMEHITNTGLWVGAVLNGTRSVSLADGESGIIHEFFPSAEPWDTVWVVNKRQEVDIPYWPGYKGISDQDFVCRYNDYGPISQRLTEHRPLYVDVIQSTHAWASPPLDETIVVDYYIIPTKYDLENVYIGVYMNGNVGYVLDNSYGLDDESFFRNGEKISFCRDLPGGPDGSATTVGEKFYVPGNPKKTTYYWWNGVKGSPPDRDNDKYIQMSSGEIMEDQRSTGDGTKSMVAFGPYEKLAVGDTLHLVMGLLLGENESDIIAKGKYLTQLKERNYKVPSPPPSPVLTIVPEDKGVVLDWTPKPDSNPEEFTDPDRADGVEKPFEGYRLYKSTVGTSGPWTLLDQYDIEDDYGQNTGLHHSYKDVGLLNNIEYYYTVTAYTLPDETIDFPELESAKTVSSKIVTPGTPPPASVGKVAVVPNPYRGDMAYYSYNPPWEKPPGGRRWLEQDRRIQFINLPEYCEIKVYTVSGDLIYTIRHENASRGYEDWNLTSKVGQAISSGIYLYTVEDLNNGKVQVDKFVVIK
ncbi:MAG: hypothetical protein CVV25_08555 [Ignavibacteriae bacterium HGW-Ignavibacteriae-4]|jgi:hypothetical protein|nr:hypothetical protein [Bacteroidota bacterium]PKL79284.1 MAG: hypothetical protein CVV25_08555 [Ignavibacteriae bacterium HGW-Ignavibacteriae-4]